MMVGRSWVLIALLVGLATNATSQSLYGSLVGTVTDDTGAAVPGATVTVTQVETNLSRSVVTNDTGSDNVPNLLPGTYEIAGVAGQTWVVPDVGEPVRINPGDVVVTRAPGHYTVADAPTTRPRLVIQPGQGCCDLDGNSVRDTMTHSIRTWGNDPRGATVFLVGAYEHLSDVSDRLLRALPPILSLSGAEWGSPLIRLLCDEVVKDEPGQAAVLDRLIDLLLTAVLKAWFSQHDSSRPAWWRFHGDPIVERALRIMHDSPAQPWTMDRLAAQTGASRATLARRFHDRVGESPMTFLRNWRMAMAADLLCNADETVSTVAEKVGYATHSPFSAAFKRIRGISPQQRRASALSTAPERVRRT